MSSNLNLTQTLLAVRNLINRADSEFLSEFEMTQQQYGVLIALEENGDTMGVTELARHIGVRQPTMTGIIKRLEQKQLLQKKSSSKDHRRLQIKLSSKAKKFLNKIDLKKQKQESSLFDKLSPTEKKQLTKLLEKMMP